MDKISKILVMQAAMLIAGSDGVAGTRDPTFGTVAGEHYELSLSDGESKDLLEFKITDAIIDKRNIVVESPDGQEILQFIRVMAEQIRNSKFFSDRAWAKDGSTAPRAIISIRIVEKNLLYKTQNTLSAEMVGFTLFAGAAVAHLKGGYASQIDLTVLLPDGKTSTFSGTSTQVFRTGFLDLSGAERLKADARATARQASLTKALGQMVENVTLFP